MSGETTILLSMALPFIAALLISFCGFNANVRESVTIAASIMLFILVTSLFPGVFAGTSTEITLGDMLPGLGIAFKLEPLGMMFAAIASFLWIITSIYSIGYMRAHNEKHQTRFYAFFAVAIGATMAVAFAGNMLTLFIAYEVLTLSTFPLITHSGSTTARNAGRTYLGILLGTSILLQLTAIIWTWSLTGTLDFTDGGILAGKASKTVIGILLALYVFGIGKAALMPFHRWLPAAMVAPTPVSALLHAVAVVKAGVFTILKVTIYIFGIDLLADTGVSEWLQYVAAATIIIASLVAMTKNNLKARLAYSTISQLAYIVLGAMLANSSSIIGGSMHIATHAFGKITLFFCAGAIMVSTHKTEISHMSGIGRVMPITMSAFLLASLSIIGLPPFGGLWSKWYLALGALDADKLVMLAVLMVSSLLNMAYLLPIPFRAFFSKPVRGEDIADGIKEAPWPCLLAIMITSSGFILLFFFPDKLYQLLQLIFFRSGQ